MGINRLKVWGDSNLKEPLLAPYQAMAQRLEDHFNKLTIEHMQRSDNRHVDTLATFGSKIMFKEESTKVTILKRSIPITLFLQEVFKNRTTGAKDWRTPLRDALLKRGIEINAKQP